MKPSVPSGDDCIRICSPDEGLGRLVMFADKAIDRRLQIDNRPENSVLEPAARQDGEKPSTAFSHELEVGVK